MRDYPNWRNEEWAPEQQCPDWDHTRFLSGAQDGTGREVIGDIEGNGLLQAIPSRGIKKVTQFWCIGMKDLDTGERFYFGVDQGPDWLEHALKFLAQCKAVYFHNGVQFDFPALEALCPGWVRPAKAWDTLVMAKVVWAADALIGPDMARIKRGTFPARLLKSHSLEAWGYRTGTLKTEYSGGFHEWCPAMANYLMTGDLDGPEALLNLIHRKIGWKDPKPDTLVWPEATFEYEHDVARIVFEQSQAGMRFDLPRAQALATKLANDKAAYERDLKALFGEWWEPLDNPKTGVPVGSTAQRKLTQFPDVTVPRFGKNGKELKPYVGPPLEYSEKGDAFVRIKRTTFNPKSRDHLGQRLQDVYGWVPTAFGKNGKPTVSEAVLGEMPTSVMPEDTRTLILDFFTTAKIHAMLDMGAKAWIKAAEGDPEVGKEPGYVYGRMDTCGAVTRRGIHMDPNLGQTPSVQKEKVVEEVCRCGQTEPTRGWPCTHGGCRFETRTIERVVHGLKGGYGWESRELFCADEGWEQTGTDASSLELIDLGHYLQPLDGGAFSDRVCDPRRDAHKEHSEITGTSRADAKTAIYLKVYGGSAFKLSLDPAIIVTPDQVPELLGYRGLPMLLRSLAKRLGDEFVASMDDMQKARLVRARKIIIALEEGIPGLKDLTESVTAAAQRGYLKAIDGSTIMVRKPHAALNSLLQSAGAITCKLWMSRVHAALQKEGLVDGNRLPRKDRHRADYRQVLWVHDELQFTHRPGLGPLIAEIAEREMVKTGEVLGLRGRYRTEAKTGLNWAQCH